MTIGSIFLGLALLILVALFVGRPFLVPETQRQRRISRRRLLLTEKEALLAQIRLLDLDFETSKIPEEVYQPQRAELMAQAAAVLQQLDELDSQIAVADAELSGSAVDADAAIEAAVARRRNLEVAAVTSAAMVDSDAAIEAAVAQRRGKAPVAPAAPVTQPQNGKTQFCPQCGQPADAGDRFCAYCGHRLSQTEPA